MNKVNTCIWHGKTKIEYADEYLEFLEKTGVKDYKSIPRNLDVEVWRRKGKDICHFWTVTKWDSYKSIKQFAGKDYEKAKYYPKDKEYLLEFEENVIHTETFIF
ncbi:MAG: antibiotic biosynthesis monooxygenase [Ignavibacteria bacterium]|nr:antibiotic biosynthesis monooxygenase [Ignavibacteria bacterium]